MTAPEVTPEVSAAELLAQHFDEAFSAPDGITRLRELILTLAMQGKLVEQDPSEGTAAELLEQIAAEKKRLVKEGKIKAPKALPAVEDDEKPYDLPQGWAWVRFGDVAQHNSGKTLDSGRNQGEYRYYITTSNLYWGRFELGNLRQMQIREDELERCTARQGDLLICEGGEAGRAAVWESDKEVCFQNHVHRARFYRDIDAHFAQKSFEKLNATGEISEHRKGVGISNMSSKALANIVFPLPPLAEQRRIVARIDQLMARCDELEALREQQEHKRVQVHRAVLREVTAASDPAAFAEGWRFLADHFGELHATPKDLAELRGAILQLAVMGKLVPQDASEGTAAELLEQIQAEKKRLVKEGKIKAPKPLPPVTEAEQPYEVPQGWAWVRLGELFKVSSGNNLTKERMIDGPYPVFGGNGINGYHNEFNTTKATVVIGRVGFYCGSIHLTPEKAWITDNAFFTKYDEDRLDKDFVIWLLKITNLQTDTAGTAQPVISGSKIYPIPLPLPPLAEQRRIVAKVDQLMGLCDVLQERLTEQGVKQGQLLGALMAQLAPSVAVGRPAATAGSGRRGRPSAAAAAPEGSSGEKRGRGRPRKAAGAEPARSIPQASSEADAIRKLEALRRARAEAGQVGLFDNDHPAGKG